MASVLPVPFRVTTAAVDTLCAAPALATGAELALEAMTVTTAVGLRSLPSLTTKLATYVPATSGVKVGFGEVVEDKAAVLLLGLDIKDHV